MNCKNRIVKIERVNNSRSTKITLVILLLLLVTLGVILYKQNKPKYEGYWCSYQEKATIIFNIPMASSVYSCECAVCTSDEVKSLRLDLKRTATYFEGVIVKGDDFTALQTPYVWQVEGMGAEL